MLNHSLAPVGRAFLFFGFMGLAVAGLTWGAELQDASNRSSVTVAKARIERNLPADGRFAGAQQAMLGRPADVVMR